MELSKTQTVHSKLGKSGTQFWQGNLTNVRWPNAKLAHEKEKDYRRMGLDLVSCLNTKLRSVKKTATIDLKGLVTSVSNLRDGLGPLDV
ncbi:unnamed protein product [Arabidopsis lyrata]|uniref:Predicted protein n=1 Tax=Arabidopsis lyrata subsp. lyrata TaxID=81972 RepID=D7KYJ8_ARALL|nr:predicted protein [Arabidopsis lyrata subsp. lyrata]CAH8256562.1 unnamed protein product [Arabidopsis lyrata]